MENLAKGFVKSTVNQVGRDGAELINKTEYIGVKWFWAFLLSGLVPVIGACIVIIRGVINLNKKHKIMYQAGTQAVYKKDRRFTTGKKFLGNKDVKTPVKVEITPDREKNNRIKAIGYLSIGFVGLFFYIYLYWIK
ncbi:MULTISPECIES: hypothetical protein [unclassified Flavobacterium]|uniref:hypothetical protein n=1 Tax=unclassified Flavobacterium TaxID=196869 RepID=UPI00057F1ED4|nr:MULTISPECIES: hypothetical protein [unclassified Flavobacterium]KIA97867.1 hypothetical protein OA93_12910 [Flavobacterium sp. KMS]OUL64167.1 hypothetical protein B8T70_01645 [Flavobacterium sp. AJR]